VRDAEERGRARRSEEESRVEEGGRRRERVRRRVVTNCIALRRDLKRACLI